MRGVSLGGVTQLPPEDLPPEPGLVPAAPEEALADVGPISFANPVAVGGAFLAALDRPDGPNVAFLIELVTPESRSAWRDFAEAAELLAGCGLTSRASPSDDPDVVYVKYVTDHDEQTLRASQEMVIMARAVATLVRRPALGGWRVHAVGEYLKPEQVPHD